jgi:ribonuclease HII
MTNNNKIIIGIDEAGRGPLAGPVLAASVYLPDLIPGLADSKKLSKAKREILFAEIFKHGKIGIGIATIEEIAMTPTW